MKNRPSFLNRAFAVALSATLFAPVAIAQFEWDPSESAGTNLGGSGTWTQTSTNWWNGEANVTGPHGTGLSNVAIFGNVGGEVLLDFSLGSRTVYGLQFDTSGYVLSAASPMTVDMGASAGSVILNNGSTATLSSNIALSYLGSAPSLVTGNGSLIVGNGASLSASSASSGAIINGSNANVEIQTGGQLATSGVLTLGNAAGASRLDVTGGVVTVGSNLNIANQAAHTSVVTISAGHVNLASGLGIVTLGVGSATLNLEASGTLSMGYITKSTTTVSSTLNLDGGTLRATQANQGGFINANGNSLNVYVKEGGAKIDTNGNTVGVFNLQHGGVAAVDGGLEKLGSGTLRLRSANTFTGNTKVSVGTLLLENVNALQHSSLDLSGAGVVNFGVAGTNLYNLGGLVGSGSVNAGSNSIHIERLAGGDVLGEASVTANTLSLDDSGTFAFTIEDAVTFNFLSVTGNLTYGGLLSLAFGDAPVINATYDLFDFTGSRTGTFADISATGLSEGQSVIFDYDTGVLTVVPEPSAGMLLAGGLLVLLGRRRAQGDKDRQSA